ncbi:MAG: conserved repeat domain, partial [Conexibacter sp.]|nr:conserved repeat domain [Conexibacter sp.]
MPRMRVPILAAVVCLAGLAPPAHASQVINLGSFLPAGLNSKGLVVGDIVAFDDDSDDSARAALWRNGTITPLPLPAGAGDSDALAVNENGKVAGLAYVGGDVRALTWNAGTSPIGAPAHLGPLAAGVGDYSQASAVDSAGEVVGSTTDGSPNGGTGFLASAGGSLSRVGDADRDPKGGYTQAYAITADGQTILGHVSSGGTTPTYAGEGYYLFPRSGGSGTKLTLTPERNGFGILGGTIYAPLFQNAMSSDGAVIGWTGDTSNRTNYIRLPNGTLTQITGMAARNAVNARHVVGGTIATGNANDPVHAAMWKNGTVTDLNTLLPASSGFELIDVLAIDDAGDMAGVAGYQGDEVGFLLKAGIVVDSTGDQADAKPGDGACLTSAATCTLRAALQEVSAGTSTTPTDITFNLPGGATTIAPATALDAATKPVALDGSTNPGGRVVLEGAGAGDGANGLTLQGDGSTVRGMDVERFKGAGIRVVASDVTVGGLPGDVKACAFPCNVIADNAGSGIVVAGAGSLRDALDGNRLTGNATPAINLGGGARVPNDAKDADTGPDNLHNFPIGVLSEKDPVSGKVKVSGVDAPADAGFTVAIYGQSAVTPARGAEPKDLVGTTQVTANGTWELDLPATVPAADHFFSATVTSPVDGSSELSPVCGDPDGDGNPDSDGDGLCDDWELHGIDADDDGTVDLPLQDATYGASPTHKDLYLEADAMASTGRAHAPSQGAIDDVVAAFAKAPITNATGGDGVALHVNPGGSTVGDTIPEDRAMAAAGPGVHSLTYLRNGKPDDPCDGAFGTAAERSSPNCFKLLSARALAFRWVLFASTYGEAPTSSGVALGMGGNTFAVTLGGWGDASIVVGGGGTAKCATLADCQRVTDEGTLMHELGHTLGFDHGGGDAVNDKPNYLSVMNYAYQFPDTAKDRPLDYSRTLLNPLDEAHLDPSGGVVGGIPAATAPTVAAAWPHIAYYAYSTAGCFLRTAPTAGPVPWTDSASLTVRPGRTHDRSCATAPQTLASNDDWAAVRYSFRDQPGVLANYAAGDASSFPPEETSDERVAQAASSDADRNGVNDLADACRVVAGSQLADADGNGFADVCESTMDQLQAFPGQANGS